MFIIVPKEDGFKDKNSMEGGKHLIWKANSRTRREAVVHILRFHTTRTALKALIVKLTTGVLDNKSCIIKSSFPNEASKRTRPLGYENSGNLFVVHKIKSCLHIVYASLPEVVHGTFFVLRFFPQFVCVVLAHLVPPATPKWKRRGSSARETSMATSVVRHPRKWWWVGFPVKLQKIRDRMRNLFSLLQNTCK